MSVRPAHCQDAVRWLKQRGWDLGPLTGQDHRVLRSIAHCWDVWTVSDESGQRAALDAVAALLDGCQEVCWPMARELVAQVGDWSHRAVVWPKVVWRYQENIRLRLGSMSTSRDDERVRRLEQCHVGLAQVQQ